MVRVGSERNMTLVSRLEAANVTQSGNGLPRLMVWRPAQLTVAPNARPSRYVAAAAP
jgi:hypothetical protein